MINSNVIIDFWFERIDDVTLIDRNARPFKKWFSANLKFDLEIMKRFKNLWDNACAGEYKDWEKNIRGRLALILLWDQFSRNMFRGSPQMYASDAQALALALDTIDCAYEQRLPLIQRIFIGMPLMHAEDKGIQLRSVKYFEDLLNQCRQKNPANVGYYEYTVRFALKHQQDIARDGVFLSRKINK